MSAEAAAAPRIGDESDGGAGEVGAELDEEEPVGPDVSWSVPIASGELPEARGGHTATLYRRKYLVVFGGHYHEGNGVFKYLNDVQILNLENLKWRTKRCTGAIPAGRYGHTATLIGSRLYIFGGRGANSTYFKDTIFLDLKTWEFSKVKTATPPPPGRMAHSATLVGNKIAVFGGWDGSQTLADFWVFATENNSWLRPRIGGPTPAPRQGHTATLLADGGLMIFGGYSVRDAKALPEYLRNTVELNLAKMEWTRLAISGELPTPRYGHRAILLDTQVVVFGGYNAANKPQRGVDSDVAFPDSLVSLDSRLLEWWRPVAEGRSPGMRYGHTFTPVGDNHFLIFGGWDGTRALNSLYDLQIHT